MAEAAHIELVLRSGQLDVAGRAVQESARRHLGIDTGRVKSGKIFTVVLPLTGEQLEAFAHKGLRDALLHDVFINTFSSDPTFRSYLLLAKLPGVTDDEGASAQRTLVDLLGLPHDAMKTQQVFSQDVFYFERALSMADLTRLGEDLLGNPLVHHFERGERLTAIGYVPEVAITAHDATDAVDLEVPDARLLEISRERVLSLSLDEMKAIQARYRDPAVQAQRRKIDLPPCPTDCELETLAQTWSEHCKHKEFDALIRYVNRETGETCTIDSLFKTFIRGSTERIQRAEAAACAGWSRSSPTTRGSSRFDEECELRLQGARRTTALGARPVRRRAHRHPRRQPRPAGHGPRRRAPALQHRRPLLRRRSTTAKLPTGPAPPAARLRRRAQGVRTAATSPAFRRGRRRSSSTTATPASRWSSAAPVGIMPAAYGGKASVGQGDPRPATPSSWRAGAWARTASTARRSRRRRLHPSRRARPCRSAAPSPRSSSPTSSRRPARSSAWYRCTTDDGAGGLASSIGEMATLCGGAKVELERCRSNTPACARGRFSSPSRRSA